MLYKVGDYVLLDPKKCTLEDIGNNSSSGTRGGKYIITDVGYGGGGNHTYRLRAKSPGSRQQNWHKQAWLTLIIMDIKVGGELL